MVRAYWQKQNANQPLFQELEWSRPEQGAFAGKLAIVGGNLHGFAAPAEAYSESRRVGIGTVHALLPDALQKTIGPILEYGEFAPSTPSGSLSQKALNELLTMAHWADGVLFAGDLGRNSETAILLEKFLNKSTAAVTLTKDAIDYATSAPQIVLTRPKTLLVLSLSQLQRLGIGAKFIRPITFSMDLLHLVDWLHEFTTTNQPYIITKHLGTLFVAAHGRVSTTKLIPDSPVWRLKIATDAAVWWLQNPAKPYEALTTAVAS